MIVVTVKVIFFITTVGYDNATVKFKQYHMMIRIASSDSINFLLSGQNHLQNVKVGMDMKVNNFFVLLYISLLCYLCTFLGLL